MLKFIQLTEITTDSEGREHGMSILVPIKSIWKVEDDQRGHSRVFCGDDSSRTYLVKENIHKVWALLRIDAR